MTVCRDTPREARSTAGQSLSAASRRFRLSVRPRAGAAVPSRCACLCVCLCACGWCRRVSVVRGQVVDVHGAPLVGVRVSVITQPLYGFTLTRPRHAQYVTST